MVWLLNDRPPWFMLRNRAPLLPHPPLTTSGRPYVRGPPLWRQGLLPRSSQRRSNVLPGAAVPNPLMNRKAMIPTQMKISTEEVIGLVRQRDAALDPLRKEK